MRGVTKGKGQSNKKTDAKGEERPRKDYSHLTKLWLSFKAAYAGVPRERSDKFKKEGHECWRCGGDNHQALHCRRKKDIEGNELAPAPDAPPSTSSTKRRIEEVDDEEDTNEAPPSAAALKRQKTVAASQAAAAHQQVMWAAQDSETDMSDSDF